MRMVRKSETKALGWPWPPRCWACSPTAPGWPSCERLAEGEADVSTLTEACGAARPSVSQHLGRLRLAGLVTHRKEGRRVVYALRHGHLRRLVEEALSVADHQLGHLPPHD